MCSGSSLMNGPFYFLFLFLSFKYLLFTLFRVLLMDEPGLEVNDSTSLQWAITFTHLIQCITLDALPAILMVSQIRGPMLICYLLLHW